jgi:hypothetical protein
MPTKAAATASLSVVHLVPLADKPRRPRWSPAAALQETKRPREDVAEATQTHPQLLVDFWTEQSTPHTPHRLLPQSQIHAVLCLFLSCCGPYTGTTGWSREHSGRTHFRLGTPGTHLQLPAALSSTTVLSLSTTIDPLWKRPSCLSLAASVHRLCFLYFRISLHLQESHNSNATGKSPSIQPLRLYPPRLPSGP